MHLQERNREMNVGAHLPFSFLSVYIEPITTVHGVVTSTDWEDAYLPFG